MGISIGDLFGNVGDGITALEKTALPAALAGIEQYGASQLADMSKANSAAAQQGVTQIMNAPGATSGIIASIQSAFKNVTSNTLIQNYGGYAVLGVMAIVAVGIFLGKE